MHMRRLILFLIVLAFLPHALVGQNTAHGVKVVVIDAGHGGSDPGACYGSVCEKEVTLKVALALGKFIEEGMPGVQVVYTRKTDKSLAASKIDDLQARANVANKAGGDLFISIHCNAADKAPTARGAETLVMGESTKEQSYNSRALYENNRDDLIDMSDARTAAIVRAYIQNLQFTYGEFSMALARCMQNNYIGIGRHSRGVRPQLLRVLYATDMPCVLTEIGFLSNDQERAYLRSEKGQNEIARALYKSVKDYSSYVLNARRAEGGQSKPATSKTTTTTQKPTTGPTSKPASGSTQKPTASGASAKPAAGTTKTSAGSTRKPAAGATGATEKPVRYVVQLLACSKPIPLTGPEFKGYRGRVREYTAEPPYRYKYGVYESATRQEAQQHLSEVRRSFPDAFVVRCRDGRIVK